jgi:excisionase family DNA binding protein
MTRRIPTLRQPKQPLLAPPPTTSGPTPDTPQPTTHSSAAAASTPPDPDRRLVLSIPEACQALGVGETMLRQLIACGQLPALRLGRRVLIPRSAVEAMVASAASTPIGGAPLTGRSGR